MIPLPDKKYSIIYADPPWGYQNRGTRAAANKHYDVMTVEDIKRMGVGAAGGGGIANDDCALFMWATFPMLKEALDVIEAWGFTYKTVAFNWVKQNKNGAGLFMGLGNWTRSNSEICLLAVQAKATLAPTNPVATALCITSDGNGEMVVAEMVPQIPGQINMDGTQQEAPKILKLVQAAN